MQTPSDPSYREIPLSKGQIALVDAADYPQISVHSWYASWNKTTKSYYAIRKALVAEGKYGTVYMHRKILGLEYGDKRQGDHAQHDTLDNRRFVDGKPNLRIATRQQNNWNTRIKSTNKTGHKGVQKFGAGRYRGSIRINGKQTMSSPFDTIEEAIAWRSKLEVIHHAEFARH